MIDAIQQAAVMGGAFAIGMLSLLLTLFVAGVVMFAIAAIGAFIVGLCVRAWRWVGKVKP